MSNGLFREKTLKRVSSPEQLDDYIRVISPGVWLVLSGIIVLLLGVLAWAVLGSVPGDGGQAVHPITFLLNLIS